MIVESDSEEEESLKDMEVEPERSSRVLRSAAKE